MVALSHWILRLLSYPVQIISPGGANYKGRGLGGGEGSDLGQGIGARRTHRQILYVVLGIIKEDMM